MKLGYFAGGLASGIGTGMKLRAHMDAQAQRDDIKAINATAPTEFSGPDQFSPGQQAQMQGLQDSGQGYYDEEAGWVGNDGAPIQGLQSPQQAAPKSYRMGDMVQDKAFTDAQVRDWKNNAIARRVMQDDPTGGMSMLRSQQGLQAGDLAIADAQRTAGKNRELDTLTAEYQEALRNPEAAVSFMRAGAGFITSAKDKDGKHRFDESLGIDDDGNWTVIGKDGKVQKYDFQTGFNKIGQLVGMNPVQYAYEQRLGALSPEQYKNVVGFADKREDNRRMDRQLDEMSKYRQGMLENGRMRAGGAGRSGGLGQPLGMTADGKFVVSDGQGGFTTKPIMIDGRPASVDEVKTFKKMFGDGGAAADPWETPVEVERELPNGARVKGKMPMRLADPAGYDAFLRSKKYGNLDDIFGDGGARNPSARGDSLGIPR
jgi:hypothetical protein